MFTPALRKTLLRSWSYRGRPSQAKGPLEVRGRLTLSEDRSARCAFPYTSTSASPRGFICIQCSAPRRESIVRATSDSDKESKAATGGVDEEARGDGKTATAVWITYSVYLLWLLVLPYAPVSSKLQDLQCKCIRLSPLDVVFKFPFAPAHGY